MTPRQRGQAATEFLLCASALAAALFVPVVDSDSVSMLLARRIADCIRGFYLLIANA